MRTPLSGLALALAVAGVLAAPASAGSAVNTSSPPDVVAGSGQVDRPDLAGRVNFVAVGGLPFGPLGHIELDVRGLRNLSGRGDVTCVEVTRDTTFAGDPGSVASLQAALDEPVDIGVFVARSIHLFVFDDGVRRPPQLDFIGFELSPLPAATGSSCLFDGFFGFSGQGSGRAQVVIAPRVPDR